MNLPTSQSIPPEDPNMPPARRRRRRRSLLPEGVDERYEFLETLSQKLVPSLDFFLFSLACGLVLDVAMLTDAPALFILAALVAPFMSPVAGMSLSVVFGSMRYFVRSLGSMVIGGGIVFALGALAGFAAQFMPGFEPQYVHRLGYFDWSNIVLLVTGTVLMVYLLVRSSGQRPLVASVALAYTIYLPLGAAGYGLTSRVTGLFPDGLVVFAVHLAAAVLVGAAMLALLGLRPINVLGYTMGTTLVLAFAAAVIAFSGLGTALTAHVAMPPPTPSAIPTNAPSATITHTPAPATITPTATNTLVPTHTPTVTVSPVPTPVYARIDVRGEQGAVIRDEPSREGRVVTSLLNGMLVEVLPESHNVGSSTYVKVRTSEGVEGWIIQSLLATATPVPGW
ncbi:MAG: SH3 domain-containing protein [Anaerolineae bacterium]|nr:SH3 domain-containing protein [Anaerolineae bacterium]